MPVHNTVRNHAWLAAQHRDLPVFERPTACMPSFSLTSLRMLLGTWVQQDPEGKNNFKVGSNSSVSRTIRGTRVDHYRHDGNTQGFEQIRARDSGVSGLEPRYLVFPAFLLMAFMAHVRFSFLKARLTIEDATVRETGFKRPLD